MKAQYTNKLVSSFLLFIDNKIATVGEAYTNLSTRFYPTNTLYNGYFTYSSPYNQIIADSSVTGATIMTGVYVNNSFVGTGQSGLFAIDYHNGRLYFSGELPASTIISGSYSIKDYNFNLTNKPDEILIFETRYSPKPKVYKALSGAALNEIQYPVVFIKNNSIQNEGFEFGGTDLTRNYIRMIALSDNQFSNDALTNIVNDLKHSYMPILNENDFPFNYLGHTTGYNYTGIVANKTLTNNSAFIDEVFVAHFNSNEYSQQMRELGQEVFASIIDLELTHPRQVR